MDGTKKGKNREQWELAMCFLSKLYRIKEIKQMLIIRLCITNY